MGIWTDAFEAKARIIHGQLAAALALMQGEESAGDIAEPYMKLLRSLYDDEYVFARLADSSDLLARFEGPAVNDAEPSATIVASAVTNLQRQIRAIAQSIAGLAAEQNVSWPAELEVSGLAPGSLVVGLNVPPPGRQAADGQQRIPGTAKPAYEAVKGALRSLATVAAFIGETEVDASIDDEFPDPAIRDAVLVAASRLAPTGRQGIDALTFYGSDATPDRGAPKPLTPKSRKVLKRAMAKPVRESASGTFEGVVRAVDLDARRFELRRVHGTGTIRCAYAADKDALVAREVLDAQVHVSGGYAALQDETPRLVAVDDIAVVRAPARQTAFELQ